MIVNEQAAAPLGIAYPLEMGPDPTGRLLITSDVLK